MKVFDLACEHDHSFEGWFGSTQDYDTQLARHLIECPMCASTSIRRMPSAPRLNLSGASERPAVDRSSSERGLVPQPSGASESGALAPRELQARLIEMARKLIASTEDVGDRFAQEARRIHYNEAPERAIRGVASMQEARELVDEGIDVMSIALPEALKQPLQ
ncbi:MAG: DUF1178 family protein [Burkholderiales bacterium]